MTTWTVAPGTLYDIPAKVLGVPGHFPTLTVAGDLVEIVAGTYAGNGVVSVPLTARGTGATRAILQVAGGQTTTFGKGVWNIDAPALVEHLDFTGAMQMGNPDAFAGIRGESSGIVLRDVRCYGNENGVLTNPDPAAVYLFEDCAFYDNGASGDGHAHNLYISAVKAFTLRRSVSHHAHVGHCVKSRAAATTLEACNVYDGPDGDSSYLVDTPNGGVVVLRDCRLQKGPQTENRSAVLAYGAEGLVGPGPHTLLLERCLLVNDLGAQLGSFIRAPAGVTVVVKDCVLVGPGTFCNVPVQESGTRRMDVEPPWPLPAPLPPSIYDAIPVGAWGELAGTAMATVLEREDAPPPPGVEGWSGLFSYGGGDLDTKAGEYVHAAVGGHAAQSWNGIVAWNYRTGAWRLRRKTTRTGIPMTGNHATYADGSIASRHTYGGVCDMENGSLWLAGGAVWIEGGADNQHWLVDEGFAPQGAGPWIGPGCVSGWDRPGKRVIFTGQQLENPYGAKALWAFAPLTRGAAMFTRLCDADISHLGSGAMDHATRRFYVLSVAPGSPAEGLYRYTLGTTPVTQERIALIGDTAPLFQYMNPGLDVDGDRLLVLVPAGLYAIALATGAVTKIGPAAPRPLHEVGTYKRFRVLPGGDVAILVNRVDQDVLAFRLRGGGPPIPPEVPMKATYVGRVKGTVSTTPTPSPTPIDNEVITLDRAPTRVSIQGAPDGLWITPYDGSHWPVKIAGPLLQFKTHTPGGVPVEDFTVTATFADGTTATAHAEPAPPPGGLTPEEALAQAKAYTDAQIARLKVVLG